MFCKGLVKRDTLKLSREKKDEIQIILAPDPGTAAGFLLLPLKFLAAVTTGESFSDPDFVVSGGKTMDGDQDILWGFLLNIIFRKVYFDMGENPGGTS